MHNFKNIIAWQKARVLVKEVYVLSKQFPNDELYGLTSQIRRASISIPSNIAEGSGRTGGKEFSRFLDIAIASSFELEPQLILSFGLNYLSQNTLNGIIEKLDEVQKTNGRLSKNIKNRIEN